MCCCRQQHALSVLSRCGSASQAGGARRWLYLHDSRAPGQQKAQLAIWEWVQ